MTDVDKVGRLASDVDDVASEVARLGERVDGMAELLGYAPASPLTVRDRFAMAALSGILASLPGEDIVDGFAPVVAFRAYEVADAMLRARERGKDPEIKEEM